RTGNPATTTADAAGFATFQWNTAAPIDSNFTISEAIQPGYVNDQTQTRCSYITPDITTPTPLPNFTVTNGGFSGTVPDDAIATCDLINRLVPTPGVSLVKSTNGADANAAPGPSIPVGSPVTWSYLVTNTGNVPLNSIAVSDDILGAITCPGTSLAPGETMTCTATGVAVAGQYENNGTVTAAPTSGGTVTATDPSHYFGSAAGIDIEKDTNGE